MIASIYARKSTEQTGVSDDQKSVARQVDHARDYAKRKGWTVAEDHVYIDDGISGAEFATRPGFLRLMNALKPTPPFQVLIMSEESRLGREAIETAYALKQLVQAGVRVFFYLEDRERTLDSPMDKVMLSLTTFADELEREKARQRTYDAMLRLARAGHVTGGTVYGYDNVEVPDGDGVRSHVARQINEAQAAVIRRIFTLSANGTGFARIAKMLTAERVPSPSAVGGFSPSTVREILFRPLYRGVIVWNRTKKRDVWGRKNQRPRPQAEHIEVPAPHLRIVSEEVWTAAHARLATVTARLAVARGGDRVTRRRDIDSEYLLSGFSKCAICGGAFSVLSRGHGRKRAFFYGCYAYHKRGPAVCPNKLVLPVRVVEDAVIRSLLGDVLRPPVVLAIVQAVFEALEPAQIDEAVDGLRAELRALDAKIANLTAAIENGAALAPLVAQLTARHAEREGLLSRIASEEGRRATALNRKAVEDAVLAQVAEWRALLGGHVQEARQLLREVLSEPMLFTPEGKSYRFAGKAAAERLFGRAGVPPLMASPAGFEPAFWP